MSRESFDKFIIQLLADEGGYVSDPKDPGGETNFGITKKFFPHLDIKKMTKEKASDIYYDYYYRHTFVSDIEDAKLAGALFNVSVLLGVTGMSNICDNILKEFGDDEISTPIAKRINATDTTEFKVNFIYEVKHHFLERIRKNPDLKKFKKGWFNRVERL